MIFKKTYMQGNFIFSNGQQAVFTDGYYETEDEIEIEALSKIYQKVEEKSEAPKPEAPVQETAKTGMISSASISSLVKKEK